MYLLTSSLLLYLAPRFDSTCNGSIRLSDRSYQNKDFLGTAKNTHFLLSLLVSTAVLMLVDFYLGTFPTISSCSVHSRYNIELDRTATACMKQSR